MKISAQFMPGDLPVFVESVRRAEEAGYARAYLVEGQLLWRDVYVYMAHGLAATDRIPFGTAVTTPRTRHYSVIASAHASLAERMGSAAYDTGARLSWPETVRALVVQ